MTTNEQHIVTLVAVKTKYKTKPLFIVVPEDRNSGQRYDPVSANSSLFDKTGPSKPKLEAIVNMDGQIAIINNRPINITKTEKGKFENASDGMFYLLLQKVGMEIATAKDKVKKGTTIFYIQDLNTENTVKVRDQRLSFTLGTKVMDLADDRVRELVIFLGKNPSNMTGITREAYVLDACRTRTDRVSKFFDESLMEATNMYIFTNKLHLNKIIGRKGPEFFFQNIALGNSIDMVANFIYKTEQNSLLQRLVTELKSKQ